MTTMHVSRSSPGNGGLPPCGRVSVVAAGASAGCILRLRGGNWEYGVERKLVRGHYDPHGSEFQVDPVARANAGSRRRIVVVADGEIIQPKSSSSLPRGVAIEITPNDVCTPGNAKTIAGGALGVPWGEVRGRGAVADTSDAPRGPSGAPAGSFPGCRHALSSRNDRFFGAPRPAGSFMRDKSVSGCDGRFRVCVGRPPGVLDASQCLPRA